TTSSTTCSGPTPTTISGPTPTTISGPYAYDDVYYGLYGNYGYIPPGVSSGGRTVSSAGRRVARTDGTPRRGVVQPTDAQRAALDDLRAANAKAVDMLKAGCPKDLPSIPTGRLAAMETRLDVTRPA